MPPNTRPPSRERKQAFALVIALSLMAFVLVLLLTITSLVRVETQSANIAKQTAQARQNALLGMQVALGELQRTAGPDTRVTAPHLDDDLAAKPNVFHVAQALDSAPFVKDEDGNLILNPDYGQNAGYLISHVPQVSADPADPGDTEFSPSDYWPYEGGDSVKPGNALLVGPGSTMNDLDENSDGVPDGYVAAPLREISGQSVASNGHYAFHIRDNGLQAQINLTDTFRREDGKMDHPEQRITAQGVGSEFLLPNLDPDDADHQLLLDRVLTNQQLDLTPFVGTDGAKGLFHGVTLQSLGLPVNVKTGGFRRDLTAVMREAEDNGGLVDDDGDQWNKLTAFQAARMQRWRDQTVALEGESKPTDMAEHRWNALNAITLRDDQNQPDTQVDEWRTKSSPDTHPLLQEKIFPPMSDLWITSDPGGGSWKQLLTHVTKKQRLADGSGALSTGLAAEATSQLNPVIARIALNFYFTLDWPTIRLHLVPAIVLWNPYSEPISTPAGETWYFVWPWEPQHFRAWHYQMKVSNPAWEGGDELWLDSWMDVPFKYSGNDAQFAFEFQNSSGDSTITIPPGEAHFFTMHEHEQVPLTESGSVPHKNYLTPEDYRAVLRQGLHDLGGYSFYVEKDIEEEIKENSQYGLDNGGWRKWQHFPNYDPDDPDTDPQAIAVNETGLSPSAGWNINEFVMHLNGRPGQDWSTMRNRGFYFTSEAGTPDWNGQMRSENTEGSINYLHQSVPKVFSTTGTDEIDDPDEPNLLPMFGQQPASFNSGAPLDNSYPGWPGWGATWSLRLPDPSFSAEQTNQAGESVTAQDANYTAPSRWLVDHNPTAPFQLNDPLGISRSSGQTGGTYRNPANYIGGFSLDPSHFDYASFSHPIHSDNQYIGLSDDIPTSGGVPRLVLYEIPDGIEDEADPPVLRGSESIASLGAFMHARPHSVGHAWTYNVWKPDREMFPREFAVGRSQGGGSYHGSDYVANAPTYAIGNSFARTLIPRESVTRSYFPGPDAPQTPPDSIPYSEGQYPISGTSSGEEIYHPGYDISWIYNEVLWDDFILTPHANRRLLWQGTTEDRDFDTSAENVLISGAFNINSTSVDGWAAMLGSMLDVELSPQDGSSEASPDQERVPLSRFVEPWTAALSPEAGQDLIHTNAYAGYRRLTVDQVNRLAEEIVEQVKLRGPFLSVSEFVNRMLIEEGDDTDGLGLSGALQTAINDAGLNDAMGTSSDDVWQEPSDFGGIWANSDDDADAFHGMFLENAEGPRTAGSPGYLLQSDVLSRIGSVLQARSDTFTVRSYGSVGDADAPQAQAWLEATVQRVAEFVDPENDPEALPDNLTALNQQFGRKFKVISFRWLSKEDI